MAVTFKTIIITATIIQLYSLFCGFSLQDFKRSFRISFVSFFPISGNIQSRIAVNCQNRMQLVEEELLLNSFHYIFFIFFVFPFHIFGTLDFLIRTTYFSFKLNIAVPSQLSVNKTSRTKNVLKRFCTIFFTMFLILHLFNHTSSYPLHNA